MSKIEVLSESLLRGIAEFNRRVWQFPDDDNFLNWLFRDAPKSTVLVAHDDGQWLAVLGVFARTYLVNDTPVECGETYAWATLPERRNSGIGIRVMKAMMERGRPLVALGGSADTMEFMPRLGFKTIGSAPVLNLPLSARVLGQPGGISYSDGIKGWLAKAGLTMLAPFLRPRPRPDDDVIRNVPVVALDRKTLEMPTLSGFQATYDVDFFDWLGRGYRGMGTFLPFRFYRGRRLAGWAFARVSEEAPGLAVGRILEFKFAPETDARDRAAMARAVCAALAGYNAAIIRCATTCQDTNAALRSMRFMSRTEIPAMVYLAGIAAINETVRISSLRADGALLPLPVNAVT